VLRNQNFFMTKTYDAFISYTHADCGRVAPEIQKGIENIAKPWWKIGRFRNVYRDTTNLAVNPHLWDTITKALSASEYLVLLASPTSQTSYWVNKEVEWWLSNKPKAEEKIIIVLVEGKIVWQNNDFDWSITNSLPTTLKNKFKSEPLYADITKYNLNEKISYKESGLKSSVVQIISGMTGKPPREIDSDEIRSNRFTRNVRNLVITSLIFMLGLSVWFWQDSEKQKNNILGLYLESEIDKSIPNKTISLLQKAWKINPTPTLWAKTFAVFNNEDIFCKDLIGETLITADKFKCALILKDTNIVELVNKNGDLITSVSHNKSISICKFHPIEPLFFTTSFDSTTCIWDFKGNIIHKIKHPEAVVDGFFSPNGKILILSSRNHMQFYDFFSRKSKFVLVTNRNYGFRNIFSNDGNYILTTSESDSVAIIWDLNGKKIRCFKHNSGIRYGEFFPAKNNIITLTKNGEVFIHNLLDEKTIKLKYLSPISYVKMLSNENGLITYSENGTIIIWDAYGKREKSIFLKNKVVTLEIDSKGEKFIVSSGNTVFLYSLEGRLLKTYNHEGLINGCYFFDKDNKIITYSKDRTTKIWDLSGNIINTFKHEDEVNRINIIDESHIITNSSDNITKFWSLNDSLGKFKRYFDFEIENIVYTPNFDYILTNMTNGESILLNKYNQVISKIKQLKAVKKSCIVNSGTLFLNTFEESNLVELWNNKGVHLATLNQEDEVVDFSFSEDGKYILTSDYSKAKLWNSKGELIKYIYRTETTPSMLIKAVFISNQKILFVSDDGVAKIVDIFSGEKVMRLREGISTVTLDNDNKKFITFPYLSENSIVDVWDIYGNHIDSTKHKDLVNNVVFSQNGNYALSASSDNLVNLINLKNKKKVKINLPYFASNGFFSPNEQSLVTLTESGLDPIYVWNINGKKIGELPKQDVDIEKSILFTPESDKIITIQGKLMSIWELNGNKIIDIKLEDTIKSFSFSKNFNQMLIITDKSIRVWLLPIVIQKCLTITKSE